MIRKIILVLLLLLATPLLANTSERVEVNKLRKQIEALSSVYQNNLNSSELKSKRSMSNAQANLLIKVVSYEIYLKLRKNGVKRSIYDIQASVRAAWLNSWVFTDLGKTHIDRFVTILQWGYDESGYKKNLICHWKAGTYIKRLNKTVLNDTTDYGAWQINECHAQNIKILNYLYESGIINFKINKIKRLTDVMDTNTNAAARCLVETDRKSRGWEWQHIGNKEFNLFLKTTVANLEAEGLYNRNFVQTYYYSAPIKTYSIPRK
jgi:hypothetical protein